MTMRERCPLLHNMSAPPRSMVKYAGLADLAAGAVQTAAGVHWIPFEGIGVFGTPVRFALERELPWKSIEEVLERLGIEAGPDHEQQLAALVNARADELPLPDGCAVIPSKAEHRVIWPDTLSALAILAKCSNSIWLRAKSPALNAALARRQATLLVPPAFAQRLPKETS
jgi:hypothetical protein